MSSTGTIYLSVVVAGFFLVFNDKARRENSVARDDQADYLRVAVEIQNTCGVLGLPGALLRGEFREDNRHPLYVALLAIHPTFATGVGLSTSFAIATIALCGCAVWRRAGNLAGLMTGVLLASNQALHDAAAIVACETLLCFLVTAGWFCLIDADRKKTVRLFAAGLLFGLAYLTKASAFMLFAATLIWIGWLSNQSRRSALRDLALFGFSFILIASPLLIRNCRVYGNPVHSFNNQLLLAENFESGRDEPNLGWTGNWERFRSRHTWVEISRDRIAYGVAMQGFVLLRSLGSFLLDSLRATQGAFYLLLVAIGLCARHPSLGAGAFHRRRWLLLGGWTLVFWLFFAWYLPIAASDRFVLPLVPAALGEAAIGVAVLPAMPRRSGPALRK